MKPAPKKPLKKPWEKKKQGRKPKEMVVEFDEETVVENVDSGEIWRDGFGETDSDEIRWVM